MFLNFRFLIILTVANRICWYVVLGNTMLLMCMISKSKAKLLYLSRMTLGAFGTAIGSTYWNLWWNVLTWKYGTLGTYISWDIPTSSRRIGKFCRMLFSTSSIILFTGYIVMLWNRLALSALFTSRVVYFLLFSSTCVMGERKCFTMVCAFFLILRRWLMSW